MLCGAPGSEQERKTSLLQFDVVLCYRQGAQLLLALAAGDRCGVGQETQPFERCKHSNCFESSLLHMENGNSSMAQVGVRAEGAGWGCWEHTQEFFKGKYMKLSQKGL